MMFDWIVRIERRKWFQSDYVGTYRAKSGCAALSKCGKDSYRSVVSGRADRVYVAVRADLID